MTDQKPRYYGDPNMILDLNDAEVNVRTANCLKDANIELLGVLLQKSEAELLQIKNFNQECLDEIFAFLQAINEEHKQNYSLSQAHSNGEYNHIGKDVKLLKSVFGLIFVKEDFEMTASQDDEVKYVEFTLKDEARQQQVFQTLLDAQFNQKTPEVQKAFCEENTKANGVCLEHQDGFFVAYEFDAPEIENLSKIDVLAAFTKAMNEVFPKAQAKLVSNFEKKYGFTPKI